MKLQKLYRLKTQLFVLLLLVGCQSSKRVYPAVGVVHEVIADKREMVINHDEIPGFMMAMTMTLKVHESVVLEDFGSGDSIAFNIIIDGNNGYIKSLQKLGVVEIKEPEDDFWEDEDDAIQIGEIMPDAAFLNLDSIEVTLAKNEGKYQFVSFVFSRCPMPNMCPALMVKYRYLASSFSSRNELDFITISFDYIYDNPYTLQKHYGGLTEPFPNWQVWSSFGKKEDMISLAHYSQFAFWGVEENDIGHSMRSLLLGPDLKLLAAWDGLDWKAVTVKQEIEKILALYKN
tara:strand:+ start:247 stop:1110 length:864 start_codon:yes stop_codon:yes gene_type:complete